MIRDLLLQGAQIDSFGVGERLITARSEPVFGGVYKLAAFEDEQGNVVPKIKLSENVAKITTPHYQEGLPPLCQRHREGRSATGSCTYDEDVTSNLAEDGSLDHL